MSTTILSTREFKSGTVIRLVDPSGNALQFLAVDEAAGAGITQLTGDVLAGPGAGSQASKVVQLSGPGAGAPVEVTAPLDHTGGALLLGQAATTGVAIDPSTIVNIAAFNTTGLHLGKAAVNTTVDAGAAGGGGLAVGTLSDDLALGGTGPSHVTHVTCPPLGTLGGGGGTVFVDSTTNRLAVNGIREDVIDSGVNVSVPNGPGTILRGPFTPVAGGTLRVELFCSDLTPGETMGYVIASDTIAANFIQTGGGFFCQIANRSGGGPRHVNFRIIETSAA